MANDRIQKEKERRDDWFRDLFESSYKRVYYTAFSITKDAHHAQDVAQETFLKAYRRCGALKDRSSANAWLDTISRNTAIDYYRKRIRRPEIADDSLVMSAVAAQPSVERHLELKLFRELLLAMKPSYRNVLLLVYEYGLTYEQLAGFQRTSVHAVKSKIYRVKAKLRSMAENMEASG